MPSSSFSQEVANDLLNLSNNLSFLCDAQGVVVSASHLWTELLGFSVEEVIGHPFIMFLDEKKWEDSFLEGKVYEYSVKCISKANHIIPLSLKIKAVYNEGVYQGFYGIGYDAFNYEESYKSLYKMIEKIQSAYLCIDEKFNITIFNSFAEEFLGKKRLDVLYKNIYEVFPEMKDTVFEDQFLKVLESRSSTYFETFWERGDQKRWYFVRVIPQTFGLSIYFEISTKLTYACKRLDEHDQLMEKVLEHLPSLVYLYNVKEKKFIYCNETTVKLTGYSVADFYKLGGSALEHIMEPDHFVYYRTEIMNRYMNAGDKEIISYEFKIKTKNGNSVWIQNNATIFLRDNEGHPKIILGSSSDITHLKNIDERLQLQTQLFTISEDVAKIGHYDFDILNGYWSASDGLKKLFGLPKDQEEYIVEDWISILHPEDREMMTAYFMQYVLQQKQQFDKKYRIIKQSDHELVYVHGRGRLTFDEKGNVTHMIGTIEDISDQVRDQTLLFIEKDRLQKTLSSIEDGVIVTDEMSNIIFMNSIAEKMTGCSFSKVVNYPLGAVYKVRAFNNREDTFSKIQFDAQQDGPIILNEKAILLSNNGKEYIVSDKASRIRDNNHVQIGVVITFKDLTEKEKLLEETSKIQKLEFLGLIASGIAHDFNNIMGGVFGNLDLAYSQLPEGNIKKYISMALNNIDRVKNLTSQLLTLSKGEQSHKVTAALFPFIQDCVRFALSGTPYTSEYQIDDDLCPSVYDKNQIGRVVDNIVINAIQAMPNGGSLKITASNITFEQDYKSLKKNNYVKISFTDSGTGIPKDVLPHIFDPFYTTKQKGSGLGLATANSIISKHGGLIDVFSEEGKGTTITIYLLASQGIIFEEADMHLVLSSPKGGVLFVLDDEESILEIMGVMLDKIGFSMKACNSGSLALDVFEKYLAEGVVFSAAILDLTMKGSMSTIDIAKGLRERMPTLPIIICSGYVQDQIMLSPREYGFTAGLAKPFTTQGLLETLAKSFMIHKDESN